MENWKKLIDLGFFNLKEDEREMRFEVVRDAVLLQVNEGKGQRN